MTCTSWAGTSVAWVPLPLTQWPSVLGMHPVCSGKVTLPSGYRLSDGWCTLTQTLSSSNSISAGCQESLVEQNKWNVLPVAQNRALGACCLPALLCPGSANPPPPPTPCPTLPSSLLSSPVCSVRKSFVILRGRPQELTEGFFFFQLLEVLLRCVFL